MTAKLKIELSRCLMDGSESRIFSLRSVQARQSIIKLFSV